MKAGPRYVTRERAQLIPKRGYLAKVHSRIALDISLLAPKAVFVRGRGVNAELGGRINHWRHHGFCCSVRARLNLIRGNFDILGRRLAN